MDTNSNQTQKVPSFALALVPLLVLISLLGINIVVFPDHSLGGPNQLALLVAAAVASAIGIFALKVPYKNIEGAAIKSVSAAMQAIIILLIVGSLIGLWIISGVVPTMIFYGLKLIHPAVFLPLTTVICVIVSLATGSSWSTTGTIGVAFIAIGQTLQIPEGLVAGAIISGAYFGDKMSPLSDTTNLAPAVAGSKLFEHIRHMCYTSVPAISIAIFLFAVIGFFYSGDTINTADIENVIITIDKHFSVGVHLFVIPAITFVLIAKKVPALPALTIGTLLGAIGATLFQQELVTKMLNGEFSFSGLYSILLKTSFDGFSIETSNKMLNSLLSRGGMANMLNTVWLIITAMIFGGTLEATGILEKIATTILKKAQSTASLIGATLGSCILVNIATCEQYLAIIIPGRMYKSAFDKFNLHSKNLSRALEDAGTVTSVLIPWNTGGAYNSTILGVPTLTYLPFCFFNLLSPIISLILATTGWTIVKGLEERANEEDDSIATPVAIEPDPAS